MALYCADVLLINYSLTHSLLLCQVQMLLHLLQFGLLHNVW